MQQRMNFYFKTFCVSEIERTKLQVHVDFCKVDNGFVCAYCIEVPVKVYAQVHMSPIERHMLN